MVPLHTPSFTNLLLLFFVCLSPKTQNPKHVEPSIIVGPTNPFSTKSDALSSHLLLPMNIYV